MGCKKRITVLALVALVLSSCATTVPIKVQRTPTMNTSGIRTIAVVPFEASDNSDLQKEIAQFITITVISRIRAANYFTLVDYTEIERLQRNGENIGNHVDALFVGRIISLNTTDSGHVEEWTDSKTKTTYYETIYDREAALVFSYNFQRARDGTIMDMVTKQGKSEDHQSVKGSLKSFSQLAQTVVNNQLASLSRDVAPYTVTESRALMEEKSRDKALKKAMKDTARLVKDGSYRSALNDYLSIYEYYDNIAAAYNAAIMYEALSNAPAAVALLEEVFAETGNPQAYDAVFRLNKNMQVQAIIDTEYGDNRNQRDRVVAYAVGEIQKALPRGAKVWVFNNSRNERDLAKNVTDNIIAALLKNGIIVVDRESSRLVEAEQNFQMSGSVSDDDFVSIGNTVGANTLITVAVTGTSSLRRLQVRVLDIETRTNIMQSDTSNNWKL